MSEAITPKQVMLAAADLLDKSDKCVGVYTMKRGNKVSYCAVGAIMEILAPGKGRDPSGVSGGKTAVLNICTGAIWEQVKTLTPPEGYPSPKWRSVTIWSDFSSKADIVTMMRKVGEGM